MEPAPPFVLTDVDQRVHRLDELYAAGPLLLVFVDRDCPTSMAALRCVRTAGANVAVVSQGRPGAARQVTSAAGLGDQPVLVDAPPYAVSRAYGTATLPTLVLVDAGGLQLERCEGWDRAAAARMVKAAGGDAGGLGDELGEHKPGCQARNTLDAAAAAELERDDTPADDGIEEMWRRGWTDGLPVVPPTRERVAAMLGDADPGDALGEVSPNLGELTLERLAACAVLAGCEPRAFPLLRAAAAAALDPAFNLHGVQNTTHFASPVVVVNGPVRQALGMNAGSNVLGFGNRANATIGRALRLVMLLTGGGVPGRLDMSTLGGPHKFGLCFPEREEASPWEPLHVELGYDAEASTVTVLGGEGPAGVSDHYSQTPEALASTLTRAMEFVWSPDYFPVGAAQTLLVVCPEHARTLGEAGWSKADLRTWIFRHARRTVGQLRAGGSGELSEAVTATTPDGVELGKFGAPEEIVIVVAGGDAGRFSAVVPPVGLASRMVTRVVGD